MKSYITVAKEHRIEYIVEKSRFIATAIPCETEEEAQAGIARINKEFWDATHNCTAYALGPGQEQQRSDARSFEKNRHHQHLNRGDSLFRRY